jgi:hypothetical protein
MADTSFKHKPGSAGEEYYVVGETVLATPFTSGGTVNHLRPVAQSDINIAGRTNRYFYKDAVLGFPSATTPTFTGTVTARVVKRNAAGTIINLSGTASITTGQAQFSLFRFPPLATVTDSQRSIEEGEWVGLQIINAGGTVSQQPGGIMFDVRLAVLRG